MIGENDMREKELIIKRFCGEEIYPLINSKWYLIRDTLWIDLAFGKGTLLHEDTEYLDEEPTWELSFKIDGEDNIKKDVIFENKNSIDEDAILYYCEHNPTYNNKLEVYDKVDNKLLVRISAECCDVNYYDGSKGNDALELYAWIDKRK